ncbi:hypothetical protein D3OALGA1CA_2297 [Olavius algarvensis associated proteobacterium Delta 3]|nr:hypothetical protein D3OALGA1CA_2297 [Olavius algarvensis associated proteobacterium Delta 3]
MNPFRYGQVVKGKDFCRRPELVTGLSAQILRGQNVYIQGERRTGKTSLIFETVRNLPKFRMVWIDLLGSKTSDDVLKRILTAVMSIETGSGFLDTILRKLSHMKPVVGVDPITGLLTLSVDAAVELKPDSIAGILDLIASQHSKRKPLAVVFDEFQDIMSLKDAPETLAQLRSKIQFQSDISYVFAGSIRKKMDAIFNDPDSAFFKSAVPIHVGPLNRDIFETFIRDKFRIGKRTLTPETLGAVFDICFHIPGDIQQLCSALWETTDRDETIAASSIPAALDLIFTQELKGYETILTVVSSQQLKLLTALARLGGKAPMATAFLKNSGIPQASSVRRGLGRLMALRIIFHYEAEYRFVNPFFRAWLLHKKL